MATTIQDLEERVDALYNSILQMQQNLNPVTEKADTSVNTIPEVKANTANIDYLSMMTGVDIPTEEV